MRELTKKRILGILKYHPKRLVWEWARDNVDYSLAQNYETPMHGPYDPDFMPYWKEPVEGMTDPDIREIWVVKASRAGGSENLLLNSIRYAVAVDPQSVLYISGDQKSVERFMDKRIKLGLRCAVGTAEKLKRARSLEHEIYFEDMDLITTWPKNKMAFKQTGYKMILGDEVSTWPEFSADMMRKRTDTYSFSHICCLSSPDPQQKRSSLNDPIFVEFEQTDQRYWFMPDPVTGKSFKFKMGAPDTTFGLKWDIKAKNANGEWNLDMVRASAHYVTPDGTVIKNEDRLDVVATGAWVATAPTTNSERRGYHLNAFYSPFKNGDFGTIAAAFLDAQAKSKFHLKVFIMEYLAEPWVDEREYTRDEELHERCAEYAKGTQVTQHEKYKKFYIKKTSAVIVSADVQKLHLWGLAREWIDGGDSGLVDFKSFVAWEDFEEFNSQHKARRVFIDSAYYKRRMEVYEFCLTYNAIPTVGSESISLPYKKSVIDPFEGKTGQGQYSIALYMYNTDIFKTLLMDLIRGESEKTWMLYDRIERDYVKQTSSEERVDGKWQLKRGHRQNHLWDCEVIQLLGATIDGLFWSEWLNRK